MVATADYLPIKDGEFLTLVGGPLNGKPKAVDFLFTFIPSLNGGLPPAAVVFDISGVRHWYELNEAQHCWTYKGVQP